MGVANMGGEYNYDLDPQEWEVCGRVQGLGNARVAFGQTMDAQHGVGLWREAHLIHIDGRPQLLTHSGFMESVYIPAVMDWMVGKFPWMPHVLRILAADVYEWLPRDARQYEETGTLPEGVGFPGQAIAVTRSLFHFFNIRELTGAEEVCVNNKDSLGRKGSVVPKHFSDVPERFVGELYHTFLSPVLIRVAPHVWLSKLVDELGLANEGFQQFDSAYYERWRKKSRAEATKAGIEHLINPDTLTLEKAFQGSRVLVVKR